jgi:hypothetical protein
MKIDLTKEWCMNMTKQEAAAGDPDCSAGAPTRDLVERLRDSSGGHINGLYDREAADAIENLRAALQWYADGLHFDKASPDAWDTVSGEPQNWWCDEAGTAMVEDGSLASMVLAGKLTGQYPPPAAAISAAPEGDRGPSPNHGRPPFDYATRQPVAVAAEPATLKLGVICDRLGFVVSAQFLADVLHVSPAKVEGASRLYTEAQFRTICRQFQSRVGAMAELYAGEVA